MPHRTPETGTDQAQAALFYARERRSSLAGDVRLTPTHSFRGAAAMAVATITTSASFPVRSTPTTFSSAVKMNTTGTVSDQHRGLVFELGSVAGGVAIWIEDDKIGIVAGGANGSGDDASGTFDYGTEIPVGVVLKLVFSVHPNTGLAVLWVNGEEKIRVTATNGDMDGAWSDAAAGSFAAAVNGNTNAIVPAASLIAPDGFDVVEPLSVYLGQIPRQFN